MSEASSAVLLLALALLCAGCGDSGSRSSSPPNGEQIGNFQVIYWPGISLQEMTWVRETVREHEALIHVLPGGQPGLDPQLTGYRGTFQVYEFQRDLQQALFVERRRASAQQQPLAITRGQTIIGYWGFVDGIMHLWLGDKLEGHGMTQMMLRHARGTYSTLNQVNSLYWSRVRAEDSALAFGIWLRR